MVVVEPGVRFERDDLWPGGHDAFDSGSDCLLGCDKRTNGVYTKVILRVARAGTVHERGASGQGILQRTTIEDVKSVLPVRHENRQHRQGSAFGLVGCPAAGNCLEGLVIAQHNSMVLFKQLNRRCRYWATCTKDGYRLGSIWPTWLVSVW